MTVHYRIIGKVQGVAFRHFTRDEANKLGITGTVQNLTDGSVDVYASGDSKSLERFEQFLRNSPGHSLVTNVEKKKTDKKKFHNNFIIIR